METLTYRIKIKDKEGQENEFDMIVDPKKPKIPNIFFREGNIDSLVVTLL